MAEHPGLTLSGGQASGGFGRSDHFDYPQRFGGVAAVKAAVLLESGTASGREPVVEVPIESYVARFLREREIDLGAEDQDAFPMRTMHFRRTFVEKMFAIHAKVEIFKADPSRPIRTYGRHYYDLFRLLRQGEVQAMLRSEEYALIKADYREVSLASFPRDYHEPPGMSFAQSDALFTPADLRLAIETDYDAQCANLCYGGHPPFSEVVGAFEAVRPLL